MFGIRVVPFCRCTTRSSIRRKVRHVLVRHEQGRRPRPDPRRTRRPPARSASAWRPPVPRDQLVTPLADAQMDSVPVVAITGQVGRGLIGTDAFQEADISASPCRSPSTTFLITDGVDIPRILAEAFYLASERSPGAVLVDIPKDICRRRPRFVAAGDAHARLPSGHQAARQAGPRAARLIADAKSPVLYVGGGVIKAEAPPNCSNSLS